ncbi:MAG: hypothetical protein ABJE10_12070 [bacterium]
MRRLLVLKLGLCVAFTAPVTLPAQTARDSVLSVVNTMLGAVTAKDTTTLRAIFRPEYQQFAVTNDADSAIVRRTLLEQYLINRANINGKGVGRIWEPTVLVRGRIAVVWAPYDFHVNGVLSNCGVDSFTLVRGNTGWQVAGITFTSDRTGCPAPPQSLGPVTP